MTHKKTILHMFCGSGGSGLGSKLAGFEGVGIDYDPRACDDYRRLTGEPAHCANLATMTIEGLLALVPECPDVVMSSSPCVGLSGCLSKRLSKTKKYQDFNSLALRGIELAVETWKHAKTGRKKPGLIVFENVPLIKSRGRQLLDRIVALLHAEGYSCDLSSHCCGEIAEGLAERRPRFLLAARHMESVPDFLRKPKKNKPLAIRQVLCELAPPRPDTVGMHRLPDLSDLNELRLACIPAGGDWRNLPPAVLLYICESRDLESVTGNRWEKTGADWEAPIRRRVGEPRLPTLCTAADPRIGWPENGTYGDRPHAYGVASAADPSATIRGKQLLVNSRSAVDDPRVGLDPRVDDHDAQRQNGGYGVVDHEQPSGTVVAEGSVHNTRASIADPRLSCSQRAGAYGVADPGGPSATIVGHHLHDNSIGSVADPRLHHAPRNDSYGVQDSNAPASVVRGEMSVRQAPSAVTDPRVGRSRRKAKPAKDHGIRYDGRGWPIPTHELVRLDDGRFVLYGPARDFSRKRPVPGMVIRSYDGTLHRPMTTAELARIQGFPVGFEFCGPASCGKDLPDGTPQTGQRKRIGNAVPPPTAYAICQELMATLIASDGGGLRLSSLEIWTQPAAVSFGGRA